MTALQAGSDPSPQVTRPKTASTRRWSRLRVLGWVLICCGALVFAFLAYQLWGTALYNQGAQQQLEEQLAVRLTGENASYTPAHVTSPAASAPPSAVVTPIMPEVVEEAAPAEGEGLGKIVIPAAEVDDVLVEGVGRETLKKGPGHMPWTPLPGQPGNAVVSGHRTTYGAPFFYLDRVDVGDEISVETTIGVHTYLVREVLIVEPTDVWVTEPRTGAWLTLTTCTPRYSASQRLVIVAELVSGPNFDATGPVSGPGLAHSAE